MPRNQRIRDRERAWIEHGEREERRRKEEQKLIEQVTAQLVNPHVYEPNYETTYPITSLTGRYTWNYYCVCGESKEDCPGA